MLNRHQCLLGTASIRDLESIRFACIAVAATKEVRKIDLPDVPVEELYRIEGLFSQFNRYKLGIVAKTKLFGQDISTIETEADLREVVHLLAVDRKSAKMWERIKILEEVCTGFTRRYGDDVGLHLYYQTVLPTQERRKFRDILEDGDLTELRVIAEYLRPGFSAS